MSELDWSTAKDFLVTGFAAYFAWQFKQLVTSVNALNVKMAVVVTKAESHEADIALLKTKIG
jgi:hypothetical protein